MIRPSYFSRPLLWVWFLPALLLAVACTGESDDSPAPIPEIGGNYTLVATLTTSGCNPPTYAYNELYAFLNIADNGVLSTQVQFVQDGSALIATFDPSECVLEGSVGAGGTVLLDGPCNDDALNRNLRISGTAEERTGGWQLESTMTVEVDGGGSGAGPDGEADCSDELSLNGPGA